MTVICQYYYVYIFIFMNMYTLLHTNCQVSVIACVVHIIVSVSYNRRIHTITSAINTK